MTTAAQMTYRSRVDIQKLAIQALAETGNHTVAAKRAGINRQTLYEWKAKDPVFADAYDQALEISIDLLELEARNRAMVGVKEPVFYKGEKVGEVHKPSDRLMELLLKAHRDKFKDKQTIDLNMSFAVEIAAFAAPGGDEHSNMTIDGTVAKDDTVSLSGSQGVGGSKGAPPKVAHSPVDEGIDIADFSDIFSEKPSGQE